MATSRAGAILAQAGRHPTLSDEQEASASRSWRRQLAGRGPYLRYRAAAAVARGVPRCLTDAAASLGGATYARVMREQRAMVERHLRRAHGPTLTGSALDREVRRLFTSYARYWVESARVPGSTPAELDAAMSYEGGGHLEDALEAGKGVIMVMPHLGGWDFGAAWFASVGGYRVTVVVEPVEPPELFAWFTDLRRSMGLEIVPLGPEATTAVLRRLRDGGVVGLLADRDILGTGAKVEFFGEPTTLPSGPATLALRTGAAILPTAVYFTPHRGHHGVVRPAIPVERTGRLRDDMTRVTQLLAHEFETLIRRAPSQWHLLQPNWPSDYEAVPK